ncbi:MAG TPA: Maf family nucleotide pyrophosphatase [Rhizomicrobium sp.]|jgi:septum formation protein
MKPLILASASSARARLLAAAGIAFETVPAAIDEEASKAEWIRSGREIAALAGALAQEKALAVAESHPDRMILGADQLLVLEGTSVSKCATSSEARVLLRRLRGQTHELVTAAALAGDKRVLWQHTDICRLTMRDFSDLFLEEYVAKAAGAMTASVGAYEIEGIGIQLFERVEGDFFSVLGLPLLPLLAQLRQLGLAKA